MRRTKTTFLTTVCLAMSMVLLSCNSSGHSRNQESPGNRLDSLTKVEPFATGRQVNLNLNVGDVNIQPVSGDRELRLVITPRHPVSSARMQNWIGQFDVSGSQANIRLQLPKLASAHVELYVPASTALNVRAGVGNLVIDGIRGDKDVDLNVGNLVLKGMNREDYASAKLRTDVGNLSDNVFPGFSARRAGFVGRFEEAKGPGKFNIRAHVGTGNIELQKGSARGTD